MVVVESPAKAKTIAGWLGPGHRVIATRGHVSDLPAKAGSVRPGEDFAMTWQTGRGAARTLGSIARALGQAEALVLATDPDREGEAIAWQVVDWLAARGALDGRRVERAAFNEVTEAAVRAALDRSRALDMDLVRAWQARRALDYLVGYGLSPLLWRKLPGCRSAGRVQSVALRLLCEREAGIAAFVPRAFWTVEAELETGEGVRFTAAPIRLDGAAVGEAGFASEDAARDAARRIRGASFRAAAVERDTLRRRPNPPFATATLQLAASRRLGLDVGETMAIAQRLYEGIDLGAGTAGLVTYPRTGSTAMAAPAVAQARAVIAERFGADHVPARPRTFGAGAVGAGEAHEAIRPADFRIAPEAAARRLDRDAAALYGLIWRRALASQMAAARVERLRIGLAGGNGALALAGECAATVFAGHTRIREDGGDDGDTALPRLAPGDRVTVAAVRIERQAAPPPPRLTEAGLVRRLEARGIGRPSTWAAIVAVLKERGYAVLHERRLVPTERGRVLTAFLEHGFGRWVDYGFTAAMEDDLDRIAAGGNAAPRRVERLSTADADGNVCALHADADAAVTATVTANALSTVVEGLAGRKGASDTGTWPGVCSQASNPWAPHFDDADNTGLSDLTLSAKLHPLPANVRVETLEIEQPGTSTAASDSGRLRIKAVAALRDHGVAEHQRLALVVLLETFGDPLDGFAQAPVEVAYRVVQALLDLALDVALHAVGIVRGELRHEVVAVRHGDNPVAQAELAVQVFLGRIVLDAEQLGEVEPCLVDIVVIVLDEAGAFAHHALAQPPISSV